MNPSFAKSVHLDFLVFLTLFNHSLACLGRLTMVIHVAASCFLMNIRHKQSRLVQF